MAARVPPKEEKGVTSKTPSPAAPPAAAPAASSSSSQKIAERTRSAERQKGNVLTATMVWREKKDGKERGEGKREMEEGKEGRKKEIEELMERAEARTKDKWTDAYRDLTLIDDNTQ